MEAYLRGKNRTPGFLTLERDISLFRADLCIQTSKTTFTTDQPLGKTGKGKIRGKKLVLKLGG